MFIWMHWWSYIIIVPGIIFAVITQAMVSSTFNKYSKIHAKSGWTADAISERLLRENGCRVQIARINGNLTDNYNPSTKTLSLSQSTYGQSGIAALGVAAHEVGHAVQDEVGYVPLKLRTFLVPVVNFGSGLAIPLIFIGIFLEVLSINLFFGELFITLGIIAYSLATVFALITLPVEFNASRRAIGMLRENGALDEQELAGAKKVLTAAAMTYVASLLTSLLYLLRFLLIISRFRRRD